MSEFDYYLDVLVDREAAIDLLDDFAHMIVRQAKLVTMALDGISSGSDANEILSIMGNANKQIERLHNLVTTHRQLTEQFNAEEAKREVRCPDCNGLTNGTGEENDPCICASVSKYREENYQ